MTSPLPRLGFKRHLTPAVVAGDATYLVSEMGVTAVESESMEHLAPLLDGSRDLPTLVRDVAGVLSPAQLGCLLGQLAQAGLVGEFAPPAHQDSQNAAADAFWESAGLESARARAGLAAGRVSLIDLASADHQEVQNAFHAAGVTVSTSPGQELTVVLCDDYLEAQLADVERAQRRSGGPWLLAKPHGVEPWIGPVLTPGSGPCWTCMAHRLRQHRQPEQYIGSALGVTAPLAPRVATPASRTLALQLIALETAKWLAGYRCEKQSSIWTLNTVQSLSRHHPVERRPQCPECGDPQLVSSRVRKALSLTRRPKATLTGGGHRALTPRQVLDRYQHLVGDVAGVVHRLQRSPDSPDFLNAYLSGSNPAVAGHGLAAIRYGIRSQSGGKGVTELDAKVGALCEALERYSATFHGDEPRTKASYEELGDGAIHPNQCQLYHDQQYAVRHEWNTIHPPFQYVCDPFDEKAVVDWTPVWSVTHNRHRMLPTAMLYFATPQSPGPVFARADSNGNAAGSSLEDAVLQGFLELVERDAVALWWYNRTRQPAVSLDSFADPWIDEMRSRYAELHRELWVLDLTSDLRIPAMAAVSRRTDQPEEEIMFGFGCHFDPGIALRRALTEMNQFLPGLLNTSFLAEDPVLADWCTRRTLANQPYLAPDPAASVRSRAQFAYTPRGDLLDDIHAVEELVRSRGMELLVLDQTQPDIGIPVVKVIVPGLRHFWARFAPGRLYDVPVRLGRLPGPIPYEKLNPIHVFV
ncbi:TOMM precursor leader peptide-binding protein [Streptomyces sp. NPDC019890]|uniref:TOMM precursor leader peptide-binding protein n=1 Tax=Streptomyces sp. NPDC019890 TaxID=3365064 RepID=UPI00384C1CF9